MGGYQIHAPPEPPTKVTRIGAFLPLGDADAVAEPTPARQTTMARRSAVFIGFTVARGS
jgi:hypothetical protein